jgi:hypothetical protein
MSSTRNTKPTSKLLIAPITNPKTPPKKDDLNTLMMSTPSRDNYNNIEHASNNKEIKRL